MKYSPVFGVSAPELGWVPSPTFILRRAAILDRIRSWPTGRVIEVGCGAGAILHDLGKLGHTGLGVESSARARAIAAQLVVDTEFGISAHMPGEAAAFGYLMSFEVLEHIDNDEQALQEWVRRLQAGGRYLISVPAHRDRWDVTDVMAGHFRRYDRDDIERLLTAAGLHIDRLETYGWPATWLIERVRYAVRAAQVKIRSVDVHAIARGDPVLTGESGVERGIERRLFPLYGGSTGRSLMRLAARAQRPFYRRDWGISWLVNGTKP